MWFGSFTFVSLWVKQGTVGHGLRDGGCGGVPASGGLVDLWSKLDEVNFKVAIVQRGSTFHRVEYPRSDCPFSIHRVMNWKAQFDTLVYTICKIENIFFFFPSDYMIENKKRNKKKYTIHIFTSLVFRFSGNVVR